MAADYLLSGKRWAGPARRHQLGRIRAWALGFIVGILPFLPVSAALKTYVQPAVLYSFVTGFVVYAVLAKAGHGAQDSAGAAGRRAVERW